MNGKDKLERDIDRTIVKTASYLLKENKKLMEFAFDVGYLTWAQVRDNTTEEAADNGFEEKLYDLVQRGRKLSMGFEKT